MSKTAPLFFVRVIIGCGLLLGTPAHVLPAPADPDWTALTAKIRGNLVMPRYFFNVVQAGHVYSDGVGQEFSTESGGHSLLRSRLPATGKARMGRDRHPYQPLVAAPARLTVCGPTVLA